MIRRRFKITKVEVTDIAVILALALGVVGVIYGFLFSVGSLLFTNYIIEDPESFNYSANIARIILYILAITTIHSMIFAVLGFLSGIVSGLLMNLGFKYMNGIRYVVEE